MAKIKQKIRDRKLDIEVEKERLNDTRLKMISKLKKEMHRKEQVRKELQDCWQAEINTKKIKNLVEKRINSDHFGSSHEMAVIMDGFKNEEEKLMGMQEDMGHNRATSNSQQGSFWRMGKLAEQLTTGRCASALDHYKGDDHTKEGEEASVKNSRIGSAADLQKNKSKANIDSKYEGIAKKESHNRIGPDKLELNNVLESQEFKNHVLSDNAD